MNSTDTDNAVRYYDDAAPSLAPRYDSISFDAVHVALRPFLPNTPSSILDIGAGSGRDARALAQMGHQVTAVEPSITFRRGAEAIDDSVRWLDDRLPELDALVSRSERYNFIICSAVLMLLPPNELAASFQAMAALLAEGGRLAISIRDPIPGEPATIFHGHSNDAILHAAAKVGLHVLDQRALPDALGRDPHHWRSFVFEATAASISRPDLASTAQE